MSSHQQRSRLTSCLLLITLVACILFTSILVIPGFITAQAEKTFGPSAPGLGSAQRLYLSSLLLLQKKDLTQPEDQTGADVKITINQGESVPSIIGKLWESGLIPNPGVFRSYLQYSGLDTSLKSGDFSLSPSKTPLEIAAEMQSSISPNVTLTILPGWRREEVANALPSSGLNITPEEFMQATSTKPEGYSFSNCEPNSPVEGFFMPGSYTVPRETTLIELLPQMLMNFEAHVSPEMKNGFDNQGLDLCQAVTLASIVQREAMVEDEMPLIASVFYNRLNNGSTLSSDPTVQYALGYNDEQGTWWTNPLSLQDLGVDSPYNTYIYNGLPPGPISNPGTTALEAVAFPAQTQYYYFRSACDGSGRHQFAKTFDEHVANECP